MHLVVQRVPLYAVAMSYIFSVEHKIVASSLSLVMLLFGVEVAVFLIVTTCCACPCPLLRDFDFLFERAYSFGTENLIIPMDL